MSGGGKKKGNGKAGSSDFNFNLGEQALSKDAQSSLLPVLQGKLDRLIGKDSGYLETLPQSVQQRVKALKKIQDKHDALQADFDKEIEALEKKYDALKNPLYNRRSEIVIGTSEPTAEELAGGEEEGKEKTVEKDNVKGIPDFWLTTFQHHFELESMVHDIDQPIMKHITDIRITHPNPENLETFAIDFLFSKNNYFENDVLSKTFIVEKDEATGGTMLEKIEATPIRWKPGKNVTVEMVAEKKQGGRGGRGGRRGGKSGGPPKLVEAPRDSFFHFFDDVSDVDPEDEDEADLLEQEYEIGMLIRTQIVQDAIKWFTGEVPMISDQEDEDDEDDDEDDDDDIPVAPTKKNTAKNAKKSLGPDDSEEDDDDFTPAPADPNASAQPECKQQ